MTDCRLFESQLHGIIDALYFRLAAIDETEGEAGALRQTIRHLNQAVEWLGDANEIREAREQ